MVAAVTTYGGMPMDEVEAIAPGFTASQQPPSASPAPAAQSLEGYAQAAIADINAGNYAGALQEGLDSEASYGTNYSATTKDPLLAALETSAGLQALDPSKKWSAADIKAYYAAFAANPVTQGRQAGTTEAGESWGKNPYGLWGDPGKIAGDAITNINTAGDNSAPDLARFAGAHPTKSFLSKYGADIAALAATVVTWGAASPLLAAAVGAGAEIAGNAAEGNATTWGSVAKDVATSAIGAAVPGLGAELGAAAGVGSTVGTALVGAGAGALEGEAFGGNVGLDAALGGISGAVKGSGIAGDASHALQDDLGLGGTAANIIAKTGVGLATGAAEMEVGSMLTSTPGRSSIPRPVSGTSSSTTPAVGDPSTAWGGNAVGGGSIVGGGQSIPAPAVPQAPVDPDMYENTHRSFG